MRHRQPALRGRAPVEELINQAAPADGDKRQRQQEHGPGQPIVAAGQAHGFRRLRVVPALVLPADLVTVEDGLHRLAAAGVNARHVVIGPAFVRLVARFIRDQDFRPIQRRVLRLAFAQALLQHDALRLHEAMIGPPLRQHHLVDQQCHEADAGHKEKAKEQHQQRAAQCPGAGPAAASFLAIQADSTTHAWLRSALVSP